MIMEKTISMLDCNHFMPKRGTRLSQSSMRMNEIISMLDINHDCEGIEVLTVRHEHERGHLDG